MEFLQPNPVDIALHQHRKTCRDENLFQIVTTLVNVMMPTLRLLLKTFSLLLLVTSMLGAPAMAASAGGAVNTTVHDVQLANADSSPTVAKPGSPLLTWLPLIWIGAIVGIAGLGIAAVLIKLRRTVRQSRKSTAKVGSQRTSSRHSSQPPKPNTSGSTARQAQRTSKPAKDPALIPIPFSASTVTAHDAGSGSLNHVESRATDTRSYRYVGAVPYLHDDQADPGDEGQVDLCVEDVTDPLDLIEMWVTLDQPKAALDYIRNDLSVNDPNSPLIQLGMLEVFRRLSNPQRYAETARLLKSRYNIKVPDSPNSPEHDSIIGLHRLPHVKAKLIDVWESDRLVPYIDTLICDNRNGTRTGLNIVAFKDVVRLSRLAKSPNRPLLSKGSGDNRAYQILFKMTQPGFRKAYGASAPKNTVSKPASNNTLGPQMRARPRYITPSYERIIRQDAGATQADTGSLERQ